MLANHTHHTITVPDDWHGHLRQATLLVWMVRMLIESGFRGRVLVMPNTDPPILTGLDAEAYLKSINATLAPYPVEEHFEPVMTIQLTEQTIPAMVREAHYRGVRVIKVYPRNVTTNSSNGVLDYSKLYPALEEAQLCRMVVCFHGEHPGLGVEGLYKEVEFLTLLDAICTAFPKLKIVLEHISTHQAVQWVLGHNTKGQEVRVAATITAHHLITTLDDVIGYSERSDYKMRVHNGCKPQPKFKRDRDTLVMAAVSGDPCFLYGGDSAAHTASKKECRAAACGVFNSTVALPLLIQLFDEENALDFLNPFLSQHGADFYGVPRNKGVLTFKRESWTVPEQYHVCNTNECVVPFLAGEELQWKLCL